MLRQVLPTPDVVNNVVLYNALFDVPNPDHDLLPQMSAQVFFVVAEAKDVTVAPMAALRRVLGRGAPRYMARVVPPGGEPVERPVEVGVSNRLMAEIRSGLQPGDEVAIEAAADRRQTQRPPRIPRL
jgi:macrolide-specific efflux system membrane fusion protein